MQKNCEHFNEIQKDQVINPNTVGREECGKVLFYGYGILNQLVSVKDYLKLFTKYVSKMKSSECTGIIQVIIPLFEIPL